MSKPICQTILPLMPWMEAQTRRLPGLQVIDPAAWLVRDEAFAEQMALRDQLIGTQRNAVLQLTEQFVQSGEACARELLDLVIAFLRNDPAYQIGPKAIMRPDGVHVALNADHPLITIGQLVQEDFAILQRRDDGEYHLAAGLICFPASWLLSQKIGRTITDLHSPIAVYSPDVARMVERMFANVPTDKVMMRANFLIYTDPALHQPRAEGIAKPIDRHAPRFVRVERQTLRRLPVSDAVIFSIHTYVVPASILPQAAHDELARLKPALIPDIQN